MIDLELEILSAAVLNQNLFPVVIENADLFISHKGLYELMYCMYDDNVNFSYPSIYTRMSEKIGQEKATALITKITSCSGTSLNMHDYIFQLRKQRRAEYIRDTAKTILTNKNLRLDEVENLISEAADNIQSNTPDDGEMIGDYASKPLDNIFPQGAAYKTGISELDEKLYGIKPGQLMIIAARPSKGKTALMLQMIENMARDRDGLILVFSMDGTKDELYSRLLARRSRVPSWRIEYHKMNDEERLKVIHAHEFYRNSAYAIKIYDTISDMNSIKSKIKSHKNVKAVFIDFLQLIGGDKSGSRESEVAGISRSCKTMSMTMKIPVVLLSQLNRAIEFHNREPILSDLRESGAIEQDANIVLFIHSGDDERQKEIEDSAFYLAKNKNGRTGKIKTHFNKPVYEFGLILSDESLEWKNN